MREIRGKRELGGGETDAFGTAGAPRPADPRADGTGVSVNRRGRSDWVGAGKGSEVALRKRDERGTCPD